MRKSSNKRAEGYKQTKKKQLRKNGLCNGRKFTKLSLIYSDKDISMKKVQGAIKKVPGN